MPKKASYAVAAAEAIAANGGSASLVAVRKFVASYHPALDPKAAHLLKALASLVAKGAASKTGQTYHIQRAAQPPPPDKKAPAKPSSKKRQLAAARRPRPTLHNQPASAPALPALDPAHDLPTDEDEDAPEPKKRAKGSAAPVLGPDAFRAGRAAASAATVAAKPASPPRGRKSASKAAGKEAAVVRIAPDNEPLQIGESLSVAGSSSRYLVSRNSALGWACTCPAYRFKKAGRKEEGCKHIAALRNGEYDHILHTKSAAKPAKPAVKPAAAKSAAKYPAAGPGDEDEDEAAGPFTHLKVAELKALLRHNEQALGGNRAELLARATDRHRSGNLPRCPSCGGGRLKPVGGDPATLFNCPGYYDDDAFKYCGYATSEPERTPFTFPDGFALAPSAPVKSGAAKKVPAKIPPSPPSVSGSLSDFEPHDFDDDACQPGSVSVAPASSFSSSSCTSSCSQVSSSTQHSNEVKMLSQVSPDSEKENDEKENDEKENDIW